MKRMIAVILAVLMLLTASPLSRLADTDLSGLFGVKAKAAYKVGDHIQFGTYPQSMVTDSSTLSKLNATSTTWKSYGCYSGSGNLTDGQMTVSDYMQYRDAAVEGKKYRAVKFTAYIPYWTGSTVAADATYDSEQKNNGYYVNEIYWFKYEPISWRVLDPDEGLIISEMILDSHTFNNFILFNSGGTLGSGYYGDANASYWASNYYFSSIREWLNEDFYETAFTSSQQSNIETTNLENKTPNSPKYDAQDSEDKIFLLSYRDIINSEYGFSSNDCDDDAARRARGSDYAKAKGLRTSTSPENTGNSVWWLRTPNGGSCADTVDEYGYSDYRSVYITYCGVRPACRLSDLKSEQASCAHIWNDGIITAAATCTAEGVKTYTCTICGETKTEAIAKKSHSPETIPAVAATCTKAGKTEGSKCAVCGEILTVQTTVAALGHKSDKGTVTKKATYTATGTKTYKCTVCSKVIRTETIPKLKAPTVAQVTGLKTTKQTTKAIIIKWSKAKNATKYEVYRSADNGKTWKKIATTGKLTFTDSKRTAGAKYQYKVRGVHTASKATGKYSAVLRTGTLTAAPKISKLTSTKSKTATVTWGKVTGAKSYKVYISTDGKTFKAVKTGLTGASFTITKLTGGKKVYVKVIAVNAYGKNSAASAVKSVTVK